MPADATPGNAATRVEQAPAESRDVVIVRVFRARDRQLEADDVFGAEPGVDLNQRGKAAHQQPGADQQREDERDLGHHEHAAAPGLMPPARGRAALFAHHRHRIGAPGLDGGQQSGRQAGDRQHHDRERQHRGADRNAFGARQRSRRERDNRTDHPDRQHETGRAADRENRRDFGDRLQREPRARGAQRHTQGELAAASRRPGAEQVRKIQAGNQQQTRHRAEQDVQRRPRPAGASRPSAA